MAVQYAFSQITTTGLKLAVDAADPLSYPGSGTTWTDVSGNGFTGTISSSISFATTNRGALVSSNSASAVSFSGSAADFGQGSFTIEMAFSPSQISGTHWLYSKNSGSFPNFGAYITGSSGSGRIVAFYNVSSTVSSSATTAVGSIVTGSNYVLDVTHVPSNIITSVYLNSNLITSGSANGSGSLSTSASLLLLNNTTASSAGTMGNLYNFKVYNPYINSSNIRKNYNSMCSRFGLPLALYTPSAPFLLNTYPGSAIAYSLRLLRSNYAGSAIRVRRSSDNTEQDIGFDGDGNLNTGALLTFCGAGNGFVTTWYDQSGNNNNATQSLAVNQPQIVNSGGILTENSKPVLQFNNNQNLDFTRIQNIEGFFGVAYSTMVAGDPYSCVIRDATTNDLRGLFMIKSPNAFTMQQIGSSPRSSTYLITNNNSYLMYIMTNGTNAQYALNGNADALFSESDKISSSQIGKYHVSSYNMTGGIKELIFYSLDQSSNRTAIESNINSYYSIY